MLRASCFGFVKQFPRPSVGHSRRAARLVRRLPIVELLEDRRVPTRMVSLTSKGDLLNFDSNNPPGSAASAVKVLGLVSGESLVAIDVRPTDGQLYGLGANTTNVNLTTFHLYIITSPAMG